MAPISFLVCLLAARQALANKLRLDAAAGSGQIEGFDPNRDEDLKTLMYELDVLDEHQDQALAERQKAELHEKPRKPPVLQQPAQQSRDSEEQALMEELDVIEGNQEDQAPSENENTQKPGKSPKSQLQQKVQEPQRPEVFQKTQVSEERAEESQEQAHESPEEKSLTDALDMLDGHRDEEAAVEHQRTQKPEKLQKSQQPGKRLKARFHEKAQESQEKAQQEQPSQEKTQEPKKAEESEFLPKARIAHPEDDSSSEVPVSISPHVWAVLGPFSYSEYGVDPLRAFGGIQDVSNHAPEAFWSTLQERVRLFDDALSDGLNHSMALLRVAEQLSKSARAAANKGNDTGAEDDLDLEQDDVDTEGEEKPRKPALLQGMAASADERLFKDDQATEVDETLAELQEDQERKPDVQDENEQKDNGLPGRWQQLGHVKSQKDDQDKGTQDSQDGYEKRTLKKDDQESVKPDSQGENEKQTLTKDDQESVKPDSQGENEKQTPKKDKNKNNPKQLVINVTRMPEAAQHGIEGFPTESGPGGRSLWAYAFANVSGERVTVNWTDVAYQSGWNIKQFDAGTGRGGGWAVGEIQLAEAATVLAQCQNTFYVETSSAPMLADVYGEHRAVHVLQLPKGRTRVYVIVGNGDFWCDFLVDSAAARKKLTNVVDRSKGKSPLIVMSDIVISDIVSSKLASPHLGIPVLNSATQPLKVEDARVLDGPEGLTVTMHAKQPVIVPGQVMILRLKLHHSGKIRCTRKTNTSDPVMNITISLTSKGADSAVARVIANCREKAARGYVVAYPDFDGSIQRLWAAPPNVSRFPSKRCPRAGCPVMLSLHGASVPCGPGWGYSYEYNGSMAAAGQGFPYPAWLVQPTNRWHWGTDWEGPGLDNALAALNYVKDNLPGAPGHESLAHKRKTHGLDSNRVLVTGHSMGGHGCFLFATHFPDKLIGAACASGWGSLNSYSGDMQSGLLDGTRRGLLEEPRFEHAADFSSVNVAGLPLLAIYGSMDDNVPPKEPRRMARLVESASGTTSGSVELVELPGAPHWFGQGVPQMSAWFEKRLEPRKQGSLRMPGLPQSFEFMVTNPVTYGTRGALHVLQQDDAAMPARFFVHRCAKVEAATQISSSTCEHAMKELKKTDKALMPQGSDHVWLVDTFNVRRLALREHVPGRPYPGALRVDGMLFTEKELRASGCSHLCKTSQTAGASWQVCGSCDWQKLQRGGEAIGSGPIHMTLRKAPLCIAHGSGPGQADQALMLANKLYFVSRYAPTIVDARQAADVTAKVLPAECASANLLMLGSPSDNRVTDHFQCSFPYLRFSDVPAPKAGSRGFALDGHVYSANHTGLLAMGPLPNGHLALLVHGTDAEGLARAASAVPVTSGRHGADFMVLGPDFGWKGEGGILAAGYLDPLWQISKESWSEPEHSALQQADQAEAPQMRPQPASCAKLRELLARSEAERVKAEGVAEATGSAGPPKLVDLGPAPDFVGWFQNAGRATKVALFFVAAWLTWLVAAAAGWLA
eukprot:TRINITY_DN658_c0_g1_i1.p1 TRINITY_DN658_c0_g1~~TRINITY_DN658_c0_g1_i1.p1  ORF type:complete len:1509 (-),score=316.42 TRINITY_DN658_c0_g1_i1:31-4557(-)